MSHQSKEKEKIFDEAKKRFDYAIAREADARSRFLDDIKFANADPDNGYQWPESLRKTREVDQRPCLTVNKVRQHNLAIVNDAKQNKPAIKFVATGSSASYDAAQILNAIARRIEYQSRATAAYDTATQFQVQGGIGYWRVTTDYVDDMSFDQDIFIRTVKDPLTILMDPDTLEVDKSDAKYAFVYEDIPRDQFDIRFPEFKDEIGSEDPFGLSIPKWLEKDSVRVAEYWRVVPKKDMLFAYVGEDGQPVMTRKSVIESKEVAKRLAEDPEVKSREIITQQVERITIVGGSVAKQEDWPGKYIPIVAIVGEEVLIEGQIDRKGHTRSLKDPQRMYNYWSSSAVEYGALQTKIPWMTAVEAIEGYESYWNTANLDNHAYLPYRAFGENGEAIPPPQRTLPPTAAPVALEGMQTASREIEFASGQYAAQMGEPGNERTGKALNARQRQGDRATYHFLDGLAIGIRFTGMIILDLLPHIYDTERVLQLSGEDNIDFQVKVDPQAKQAFQEEKSQDGQVVAKILNPNRLDGYDVMADVGPGYATRRQEAFEALTLIMTQAPGLTQAIGDLMFQAADFPLADEAARRLRRMVPPAALGQGPSPAEQELQGKLQEMEGFLQKLVEDNVKLRLKLEDKDAKNSTDEYNALTNRLKALLPNMAPEVLAELGLVASQESLMVDVGMEHQMRHEENTESAEADAEDVMQLLQQLGVKPQVLPHHVGMMPNQMRPMGPPPGPPPGGPPRGPQGPGGMNG